MKKNYPFENIIDDLSSRVTTRRKDKVDYLKLIGKACFILSIEPKNINEALKDEFWMNAMHEELGQFK